MAGKWLEVLKEIAPRVTRATFLFNPPTATFVEGYLNSFKAAAAALGVEVLVAPVHDMPEVESSLPHMHASQIAVSLCYRMPSLSSIAQRLFR